MRWKKSDSDSKINWSDDEITENKSDKKFYTGKDKLTKWKKNHKIHQTQKQIYYTGNDRATAYTKELLLKLKLLWNPLI